MKHGRLAMSCFGSFNNVVRKVVRACRRCGKGVGLTVELLRDGPDEPKVDAQVSQVAGDFFDAKHVGLGHNTSVDLFPELRVRALRRWMSVDDALEPIDHRLVVHENVHGPFGTCRKVDNGEGLRNLGVLR
jgi:hypothetical protein